MENCDKLDFNNTNEINNNNSKFASVLMSSLQKSTNSDHVKLRKKRGTRNKNPDLNKKILEHLKGQNKAIEHEDKLKEFERINSGTKSSTTILVVKKKFSKKKSLGIDNEFLRNLSDLNQRVKSRNKKITIHKLYQNIGPKLDKIWQFKSNIAFDTFDLSHRFLG